MRARWAAWALAWCACAAAAPADPRLSPSAAPAAPSPAPAAAQTAPAPASAPACNPLLLKHQPPLPPNVREYEAATVHTARALAELVELGAADETRAAALARAAARAPLSPPPAAVALGAPQLHLGVLYVAEPPRLIVFQQNNSVALRQFWRTLASAWNATTVLWSNAWFSCDSDDLGWWGGAAAARGAGPSRAAAAIFRRWPSLPCEEAMYERLGGPPLCDPATSLCEALPADSSKKLEYRCKCRDSHWHESGSSWVEGAALRAAGAALACRPCGVGSGANACLADVYRAALLAANLAGMLICLIIGLIIFKKRKCKAVAMVMWTVLEVVLLGALLIYASAASQYISEPRWRCVAGAWLRELGFVACYGSVVLRLWVLLAEFRTRKAHRWTPRDSEVLRVVGAMVCGAGCYLAAFTATSACGDGDGCARAAWHHVTAAAELLLLAAGARIAYAARNANVPFQERGWLSAALCCEGVCGVGWRAAALWGVAPERSPLAASARAHLSAGAALACVLAPRLWHGYRARSLAQEVRRLCIWPIDRLMMPDNRQNEYLRETGIPPRAGRGLRRGGRGGGDVGGGARGAEAAVRAAGDHAQQDAAPGQPAHQQASRRAQAAAPAVLATEKGQSRKGAAGAAGRQGEGRRQRQRGGGERGGRRVAHARGLRVLRGGALALHRRRHTGLSRGAPGGPPSSST